METLVYIPAMSLLHHPELQFLHLELGFREDDLRPVCEALGSSGTWLSSRTLRCVTSGKALNFSESPLPHLSDGHYNYGDLKIYCLGQNALL